jgi:predicted dehydrogenase
MFGPATTYTALKDKVSSLEVDIDDIYSAVMRFEQGVQASMVIEVVSRPAIRQARIIGEEGTLIWDWNARLVREWSAANGDWVDHPDPPPVEGPGGEWVAENMYIEEMRGYLDAIENGQERWPFSVREDRDLLDLLARLEADSDRLFAQQ